MMGIAFCLSGVRIHSFRNPLAWALRVFAVGAFVLSSSTAFAGWSSDPAVNNAICTATGNQRTPQVISDGVGGAIIAWHDARSGGSIYAQRVNATGAAQWAANGVAICTGSVPAPLYDEILRVVSDGSGGAIIAWEDYRSLNSDIYAQRVDSSGAVQWAANGVAICSASGTQDDPELVSDGSGGAVSVWRDYRNGNYDIYAQRVNSAGAVQWTANGVAICTATDEQDHWPPASDGAGGAIIVWQDRRSGTFKVYAQRINSAGAVQWTANGLAVCGASGGQYYPKVIGDGAGGAIMAWHDFRSGAGDIYAQRVSAAGALQWAANGTAICTAANDQLYAEIAGDGAGGAIVTWQEYSSSDISAQRVNSSGAVQWAVNGVAICTATGNQTLFELAGDGSGGATVTWQDDRSGTLDIYAQRVDSAGTAQWPANGVAISTATDSQQRPKLLGDGAGGAIVTWQDNRSGLAYDIYASQVSSSGALVPVELSVFGAE
jgi:hypothetical protein